ncbi:MAG: hypothetical protein ACYCT7_06870 [bacterium]
MIRHTTSGRLINQAIRHYSFIDYVPLPRLQAASGRGDFSGKWRKAIKI